MEQNLFSLKNRVIVVTGGYGHLGAAMSKALADSGATVVVAARSEEKFNEKFPDSGAQIIFEELDIYKHGDYSKLYDRIHRRFGRIDALINNAFAMQNDGDQVTQTSEVFQQSMDGLLSTVYAAMQAIVPFFRKQGKGRIVNVASMYGFVAPDFSIYKSAPGFVSLPNYGAAKAAIIQITKYYASLLGPDQISVNCISPGPFPSPFVASNEVFTDELKSKTVFGRIGKPEEIGGPVVFLCSDAASFITGHNLIVDGGWTIR
jgi:gluconate 5-dehydrogenase